MSLYRLLKILLIIYLSLNPITVKAQIKEEQITNNQSANSSKLKVGVAGEPLGVIVKFDDKNDQTATGVSIEVWEKLAEELNLEPTFRTSLCKMIKVLKPSNLFWTKYK